jgi:hypothetical protein
LGIFAAAAGETNLTGSKVEFGRKKKKKGQCFAYLCQLATSPFFFF